MKKGYKAILIAAAILLGTGIVATCAGMMMGGSLRDINLSLLSAENNGSATVGNGAVTIGSNGVTVSNTPANKDKWVVLKDESYTDVKSLDIDAEAGNVIIQEGDKFAIYAEGESIHTIHSKVEDGRWRIETQLSKGRRWGNTNMNGYTMTVTLPKGWQASELDIDMGAGVLTADILRSNDTDISVGVGEAEIGRLESARTDIECGMGVVEIKKALVTGMLNLDCGMGEITMEIEGKEADYDFDYSVGMGRVVVGGSNAAGLGAQNGRNTDSANLIDIDCGMGVVEVSFTEGK